MMLTPELINRFLNKQCTSEEASEISNYLKENPGELDKYLNVAEWNNVEDNHSMPEPDVHEVWTNIRLRMKTTAAIRILKRTAVAAAVVAAVIIAYNHMSYTAGKSPAISLTDKPVILAKPLLITKINHSKKVMIIILQDSSAVHLYPGAVVKYEVPFPKYERAISLQGEAFFSVSKNKAKPFVVSTGSLTTTALGTTFKITSGTNAAAMIRVQLFTGKVVIRSGNRGLKGWTKDIYLVPGEQMRYEENKVFVSVHKVVPVVPIKKSVLKFSAPAFEIDSADLSFDGSPLANVFNRLSAYYSVHIDYSKADITAMSFTGNINKKDSLINILQLIGRMNDLQIIKDTEKFVVQKGNRE